jgi:hypothetical protein
VPQIRPKSSHGSDSRRVFPCGSWVDPVEHRKHAQNGVAELPLAGGHERDLGGLAALHERLIRLWFGPVGMGRNTRSRCATRTRMSLLPIHETSNPARHPTAESVHTDGHVCFPPVAFRLSASPQRVRKTIEECQRLPTSDWCVWPCQSHIAHMVIGSQRSGTSSRCILIND